MGAAAGSCSEHELAGFIFPMCYITQPSRQLSRECVAETFPVNLFCSTRALFIACAPNERLHFKASVAIKCTHRTKDST